MPVVRHSVSLTRPFQRRTRSVECRSDNLGRFRLSVNSVPIKRRGFFQDFIRDPSCETRWVRFIRTQGGSWFWVHMSFSYLVCSSSRRRIHLLIGWRFLSMDESGDYHRTHHRNPVSYPTWVIPTSPKSSWELVALDMVTPFPKLSSWRNLVWDPNNASDRGCQAGATELYRCSSPPVMLLGNDISLSAPPILYTVYLDPNPVGVDAVENPEAQ
jgi:hypothetical protein